MNQLEVVETIKISRPADQVKAQFGDVAHHAAQGVHPGVAFEVLSSNEHSCRYRQVTRVGPLRLAQELELHEAADGSLVNRICAGQFAGGEIVFAISPNGPESSTVEARLTAPLHPGAQLVRPLLERTVRRSLRRALEEDRLDLESGAYAPPRTTVQ